MKIIKSHFIVFDPRTLDALHSQAGDVLIHCGDFTNTGGSGVLFWVGRGWGTGLLCQPYQSIRAGHWPAAMAIAAN